MRTGLIGIAMALAWICLAPGQRVFAQSPMSDPSGQSAKIAAGDAEFGFRLLARLAPAKPTDNVLISPLSLDDALALAYNGANGKTKSEMSTVLGLGGLSLEQADNGYSDLNGSIANADPKTEIDIANALWVRAGGGGFSMDYLNRCRQYLNATPQTLDFMSPISADTINRWVSDNTRGNITQIIESSLLRRSDAVLTNAVYFHGTWTTPFNKEHTRDLPFHKDDGTSEMVPMMYSESPYAYWSSDSLQMIALPYGNRRLSMVVILPKDGASLTEMIGGMSDSRWQQMLGNVKSTRVSLSLPRFRLDYKDSELAGTLGALGMPTAVSQYADFSGTGIPALRIGAVVHEATMDVDEAGTVASAATGIMMMPLAVIARPSVVMTVDHPFFCAISDSVTGAVLFAGVVRDPQ